VRRLRDFCDPGSRWRAHGSLPWLQFRVSDPQPPNARDLYLQDTSHLSRAPVYRVEVFWGEHRVLRRWLLARTVRSIWHRYSVGTCRYVGKKLHRDPRGQLYCRLPIWNHTLTVHRQRPYL
jgi:hypothetical protein